MIVASKRLASLHIAVQGNDILIGHLANASRCLAIHDQLHCQIFAIDQYMWA